MELSDVVLRPSRLRRIGVVALAAVLFAPLGASAMSRAPAPGVVFGGSTAQDFPVVLETAKKGRQIARAMVAIRLTCTSGAAIATADGYRRLTVNRKRKFAASFGPETLRNPDGTTTDLEGAVSGSFNSSRTRASGKWSLKATQHDAAGAVTDTCDSGSVSWSAAQ